MTTLECQNSNPVAFWILGLCFICMLVVFISGFIASIKNTDAAVQKSLSITK